ncbi:von Willebrand factor A domain-containing protein 7 [Anabarilius grahami]|uniref:von Willebrand factor A domain-containing protein 7 n=1 Tax=Anabarilius grahami TaxID=495550 RepID=A0A3N0YX38_ANAGA|nr:von Willebrand factor A domain-containing protein 7 [Anabarilius grahami]
MNILDDMGDFYSHSNWIELKYTEPCTALINPEETIPNPADKQMKTCDDSSEGKSANIVDNIIQKKFLTSGYARTSTPKGKCSHGNFPGYTAGINKDYSDSSHGQFHMQAADVSINASVQLLKSIWGSLKNDKNLNFFRLMGLHSEKLKDAWKPNISVFDLKERYPDASEDLEI